MLAALRRIREASAGPANGTTPMILRLPVVIRIKIYRHVFKGSKVTFDPSQRRDITKPVRNGQCDAFVATKHFRILLACKQFYKEARAVFCEETQHSGGSPSFMADSISNFTKAHVKHLGGISLTKSKGEETANVLSQFPKLETCEV